MRYFTAHLSPGREPVLIREGFAWGGLFFGPFWLLWQRAWIPGMIALVFYLVFGRVAGPAGAILGLVQGIATGVFGRDLVRWSWERRGFTLDHVLAARDHDAALGRLLAARPDLTPLYADMT